MTNLLWRVAIIRALGVALMVELPVDIEAVLPLVRLAAVEVICIIIRLL